MLALSNRHVRWPEITGMARQSVERDAVQAEDHRRPPPEGADITYHFVDRRPSCAKIFRSVRQVRRIATNNGSIGPV
jgi:hypothetical protein